MKGTLAVIALGALTGVVVAAIFLLTRAARRGRTVVHTVAPVPSRTAMAPSDNTGNVVTQVVVVSHTGFRRADASFLNESIDVLRSIVNDPAFLDEVAHACYQPDAVRDGHGNQTAPQVAAIIAGGWELVEASPGDASIELLLEKNATLDVETRGNWNGQVIQINSWWFDHWRASRSAKDLAALILHEWMHVAGFGHHSDPGDPNDVAFQVERIAATGKASCREKDGVWSYLSEEELAAHPVWHCRVVRAPR